MKKRIERTTSILSGYFSYDGIVYHFNNRMRS